MRHAARFLLVVMLSIAAPTQPASALDESGRSAAWLLERATLVHDNGMHNVLLRALRQMRDPELKPFFEHLVQRNHPTLRIHGVLGLAEIDPETQLDLELLADLEDASVQAQLVSSAIENDLLTLEQCEQLIGWPGLDSAVKIIVATRLISEDQSVDSDVLSAAQDGDNQAMAGMAALLKMQQGDVDAITHLNSLSLSETPGRDNVRAMLLQTAVRFEFKTIGPWALQVAQEPRTNDSLRLLGLRTAIRFGTPQSVEAWTQRFESSTSPADRIRLAVMAMDLADKLNPALFDLLLADNQPVVQQMGRVGKRLANGESGREQILNLLEHNHLLAGKWVLEYAKRLPIDDALAMLVGVILAAEGDENPVRFRGQRLENAVMAAQDIAERAEQAGALIPQLIESSPDLTQEAILMGLIRSKHDQPERLIADIHAWPSDTAAALALLLNAKHGNAPTGNELQDLALIVRGGAGLQEPLRVQAAWIYLKVTEQTREALADVLR
ncbi:MAG: hypothetical protein WD294_01895 [Phycisphaeraceae bacterium]